MNNRHGQISYRSIGHTEVWVCRTSPETIDVTVYDAIAKTETTTTTTTLDKAYTVVSDAITRELRRQQGETL
jgi:hypothetical protein